MPLNGGCIAKLFIQHINIVHIGRRPGGIVSVHSPVGRGHVRYTACCILRIFNILHPFGIKQMGIEHKAFTLTNCDPVA